MKGLRSKLNITVAMLAIAFIALGTATYAWFTVSMSSNVQTMELEVTSGNGLRINTVYSANIEDYFGTVSNGMIETQLGSLLSTYKLQPLTSGNGTRFFSEQGNVAVPVKETLAATKRFLQFDLYFICTDDAYIHLTDQNSAAAVKAGTSDGTAVIPAATNTVAQSDVIKCMRISFTPEGGTTVVYEPNKDAVTTLFGQARADNGDIAAQTTFDSLDYTSDDSRVFTLSANTPKRVTVCIWIEGEDAECLDPVILAQVLIRFRFVATDAAGVMLD